MIVKQYYSRPEKNLESLKNILILGTSEFGITNEIVEIQNEEELIKTYGKYGSIYNSYLSIMDEVDNYNVSIYVLKPYGSHSYAYFNVNTENEIFENALIFKSVYSNSVYNDVEIDVNPLGLFFTFPSTLNLEKRFYYYKDYLTLQSLIDDINKDTKNGNNVVFCDCTCDANVELDESFYIINKSKKMSGGNSDLFISDNMKKYTALETAYSLIHGFEVDYIVLSDVYYNDKIYDDYNNPSKYTFYNQLHELCINQLKVGILTIGMLNFNTSYYNSKEEAFEDLELINLTFRNKDYINLRFLMIIIYDSLYVNYKKDIINPSLLLAFTICKYKQVTNVVNKPLENAFCNQLLEIDDIEYLNNSGILCFRNSAYYDSVVVANGVTNYDIDGKNEYKYITTVFMLQNILGKIKSIFESYLGEKIDLLASSKQIDNDMIAMFNKEEKNKNIDGYEFTINYDIKNGSISYELSLKNMFMVEGIKYIGNVN